MDTEWYEQILSDWKEMVELFKDAVSELTEARQQIDRLRAALLAAGVNPVIVDAIQHNRTQLKAENTTIILGDSDGS